VPLFVTAAPAGWASPDMIRVFVTTDRALSGTPGEVPRDEVTPSMLALATRPSAALPTPDPVDAPPAGAACTGASLRGVLRGSPWDPRVAWLDTTPVRWPDGDSAVFVPDLRLMGPDGGILAEAGQQVGVVGSAATPGGDGFDACAVGVP
jgi:hypothetical protein